jgi:hypothetical protein
MHKACYIRLAYIIDVAYDVKTVKFQEYEKEWIF